MVGYAPDISENASRLHVHFLCKSIQFVLKVCETTRLETEAEGNLKMT